MAVHVRRECSATSEELLKAIRDHAPERGEHDLPEWAHRNGIRRTVARTGRDWFRLRFKWNPWYDEGDNLELTGSVTARPGGGTILVARAGRRRGMRVFVILFAGFALVMAVAGAVGGAALLVGITLVGVALMRWQDKRVSRTNDPEAAYLVERLEYAISQAELPQNA